MTSIPNQHTPMAVAAAAAIASRASRSRQPRFRRGSFSCVMACRPGSGFHSCRTSGRPHVVTGGWAWMLKVFSRQDPSKLNTRVRFPSPAPIFSNTSRILSFPFGQVGCRSFGHLCSDNTVGQCRRSRRMKMLSIAVHESGIGTKRTRRSVHVTSALGGRSDILFKRTDFCF
jgi:hypothetical protein